MVPAFTIRHAKPADFESLYNFIFDKPKPTIRHRSREDVEQLVDEGAFFIAIDQDSGRIIGCCYVYAEKEGPYEFGGAYVEEEYRKHGIFWCLGLAAIVSHFANNPDWPLMAHVVSDNAGPVSQLKKLHFNRTQLRVPVKRDSIPGIEHMPADEQGNVHADIYDFPMDQRISAIKDALDFPGVVTGKDGQQSRISYELKFFSKDRLEELKDTFS